MWLYVVIGAGVLFFLIICFCLSVANFSFDNFKEKRDEAGRYRAQNGMFISDFVEEINDRYLGGALSVKHAEEFRDHFAPNYIALSPSIISSNSLASFAIIAHELGHALQYKKGELTKHWQRRSKNRILGKFFLPLVLVGVVLAVLGLLSVLPTFVMYIGIGFLGLGFVIFLIACYSKYLEIRVEKSASKYGMNFLKECLTKGEAKICEELLNSARLTYWGSLFRTMLGWTMLTKKDKMFN